MEATIVADPSTSPKLRDTIRAGSSVRGPAAIPVIAGIPFLGSMMQFRRRRLELFEALGRLGKVSQFRLGPIPVHMITDAAMAQEVLVDQAASFVKSREMAVLLRPLLGDGLLTAEGDYHRRQRRLQAPAYTPARIASYGNAMVAEAVRSVDAWRDGDVLDMTAEIMEMVLAIAGRALFSVDIRGEAKVVGTAFGAAMEAMLEGMTSLLPVPYGWPLPRNIRMRRAVAMLDDVVFRVIAERRAAGGDRGDVLSALIDTKDADGTSMTDRQIRDEVMTLILAGHETSANAMCWALYAIARNPEVRARIVAEVDRLGGRPPTTDDVPQLSYTLMVLEEAMRLFPPAYVIGRAAARDVEIGGYSFPAGAIIMINTWAMHRDPSIFPDPERFIPERFSAEAKKQRPRGAYLPFGAGPRVCLGSRFALLEAQLALATIIGAVRFDLVAPDKVQRDPVMTLRPKSLDMRVWRR